MMSQGSGRHASIVVDIQYKQHLHRGIGNTKELGTTLEEIDAIPQKGRRDQGLY